MQGGEGWVKQNITMVAPLNIKKQNMWFNTPTSLSLFSLWDTWFCFFTSHRQPHSCRKGEKNRKKTATDNQEHSEGVMLIIKKEDARITG